MFELLYSVHLDVGSENIHPAINEALHPVVLLSRLKGNQVHAPFPEQEDGYKHKDSVPRKPIIPAVVPCVEPVPLGVANL